MRSWLVDFYADLLGQGIEKMLPYVGSRQHLRLTHPPDLPLEFHIAIHHAVRQFRNLAVESVADPLCPADKWYLQVVDTPTGRKPDLMIVDDPFAVESKMESNPATPL